MNTELLPVTEESLNKAGELIRAGQLVAFPTETVYGLGADALNEEAVRSIFAAKGRPQDNPLIVHISDRGMLDTLCEVNPMAEKLMNAFWPGPLTLLLPKRNVPDTTTAGLRTVGVRMPGNKAALDFIRACRVPIAAPSANLSGRPSPTTALHVFEDMTGRIPLILDGGDCRFGVESTVCDCSGDTPTVLRPGAVTAEMIAEVCGESAVSDAVMRPLQEGESAPSPGMKHRHYAPKGRMTLYVGENTPAVIRPLYLKETNACILCHEQNLPAYEGLRAYSLGSTPAEAAHLLFDLLRRMDEEKISRIFAEGWKAEGEALAVMNRMARAAAFDIVEV